jgi:hypothetical protein
MKIFTVARYLMPGRARGYPPEDEGLPTSRPTWRVSPHSKTCERHQLESTPIGGAAVPRPKAPCGTYSAYKRHLRDGSPVDAVCAGARDERTREVAAERSAKKFAAPVLTLVPADPAADEKRMQRVEVLREGFDVVRAAIAVVKLSEPARLAPLLKEQREIARELGEIDAAEGAKSESLGEQLARARAARQARA